MKELDSEFFTLDDENGLVVTLSSLGAGIASLNLDGKPLILEFENVQDYLQSGGFHGKTLARVGGRVPSVFMVDGKVYSVVETAKDISLHGGKYESLSFKNFQSKTEEDENEKRVVFSYLSPDLEAGYPGNVEVTITYALSKVEKNVLSIKCEAVSDKDTIFSISNHTYWNFFSSDNVNDYKLTVRSSKTGVFKPGSQLVVGIEDVPSYLDFRNGEVLKDKLDQIQSEHPEIGTLDHTYILDETTLPNVTLENSKVKLDVYTDFDSVNFYVDNSLNPFVFKNGDLSHNTRRAIAIEPESFPMLSNLYLKANEKYSHYMKFKIERKY